MTEAAPTAQPTTMQVHPLAALQEANFDNEVHRNRRLMLANDIHALTQMVAQRDVQIERLTATVEKLEAEVASLKPAEAAPEPEGE